MKYKWDIKYLYGGITAFLVLALSILFYNSISKMGAIFSSVRHFINIIMPVVYGTVIAYLLCPIVNFLEKKFFFPIINKLKIKSSKKINKTIRTLSVFISITLLILVIYGLLYMLIPQLIDSITTFAAKAPEYSANFQKWSMKLVHDNPIIEKYFLMASDYFMKFLNDLLPQVKYFLTSLSSGIFDFVVVIKNVIIGFIISIYLLNSKELFNGQAKKLLYAVFKPRRANSLLNSFRFVHKKFSGFIIGKIIDSIIIGIICYIVTFFMKTPYNVLISVIIGVTNVIPFFGPYIGAIPSAFLILLVDPIQAIYFVIFIIILQTFDGNILGPRILSESTDLSSFWIIFAILLMGGLFGVVGMFIGVPIFAVIYTAITNYINKLLYLRRMPLDSNEYLKLDYIELQHGAEKYGKFVYLSDNVNTNEKEHKNVFINKWGFLDSFKEKFVHKEDDESDDKENKEPDDKESKSNNKTEKDE